MFRLARTAAVTVRTVARTHAMLEARQASRTRVTRTSPEALVVALGSRARYATHSDTTGANKQHQTPPPRRVPIDFDDHQTAFACISTLHVGQELLPLPLSPIHTQRPRSHSPHRSRSQGLF